MDPEAVPERGGDPRLVDREPRPDPIAERVEADRAELAEAVGRFAGEPAPLVLECLRQVPVIERRARLNATLEQCVDQPVVERHSSRIRPAAAARLDARPGDGKAIRPQTEPRDDLDVLSP